MSQPGQGGLRFQITGNAKPMAWMFKTMRKMFASEYEKIVKEGAVDLCKGMLEHSYPAPGNDPKAGASNTATAEQQGQYNVRKDIEGMFKPIDSIPVREFVAARSPLLWNLKNPIEWRNPDLKAAWERHDMDTLYNAFMSKGFSEGNADTGSYYEDYVSYDSAKSFDYKYVPAPSVGLQKSMMKNGRWDKKSRVYTDREAIQKFILQRYQSIGKSANGWVDCLKQLGAQVSAASPGKGVGKVTVARSKNSVYYAMSNPLGDPNGMVTNSGVIQKVEAEVQAKMEARFKALVDKITKVRPPRGKP